jgi:hypothetical protein
MDSMLPINLSIISNDLQSGLSALEVIELGKTLRRIRVNYSGQVVLHHGCSTEADGADIYAHRFAWDSGWRIEGHPAYVVLGQEPRQLTAVKNQLDVLHPAQRLSERDANLTLGAEIIVAIRPRLSQTKALLTEMAALGWPVITIDAPKPERPTVPAQAESVEMIDWTPRIHNYLGDMHR